MLCYNCGVMYCNWCCEEELPMNRAFVCSCKAGFLVYPNTFIKRLISIYSIECMWCKEHMSLLDTDEHVIICPDRPLLPTI